MIDFNKLTFKMPKIDVSNEVKYLYFKLLEDNKDLSFIFSAINHYNNYMIYYVKLIVPVHGMKLYYLLNGRSKIKNGRGYSALI